MRRILKFRFKIQRQKQAPQQRSVNNKHSPKFSPRKNIVITFKSVLRLLRIRTKKRDIIHMDRMLELKSLSVAAVQNQDKSCVRTKTKITTSATNFVTSRSKNREKSSCFQKTGKGTSPYNVFTGAGKTECSEQVEEACRSFENYLVEMIVEEGRMMDLMDIEQLLYCWSNLRCPVFIDLVSTFYRELCKDLFTAD